MAVASGIAPSELERMSADELDALYDILKAR